MSLRLVVLAAAFFFALTAHAARPNFILILADDLGWTDLGCYGSKYCETPEIDRLAREGVRFTEGYTCGPNCQPTRAALMSGQYGPRTGVYTVGSIDRFNWRTRPLRPVDNVEGLAPRFITVAEALQQAGYATGLFGKWHLGNNDRHPSRQGFDEAIVTMGKHFDFQTTPPVEVPTNVYLADFLTDKSLQFIEKHRDKTFFLCLHHFAVHAPHVAKPDLAKPFESKSPHGGHSSPVYAAMIASIDQSVGRVLAKLNELNLTTNTVVIFTSDNGGVGGYAREGIRRAGDITDNAPLRGGKGMLYEGGIRVPYIFRWPGRIPSGATSRYAINSVDLYPTLLTLAGVKPPADYTLDGTGYATVLENPAKQFERPPLFWHFPGYLGGGEGTWRTTPVGAIRDGNWKLMEFFEDGRRELYNLAQDPGERKNLASKSPEKLAKLSEKLASWRKSVNAPMPATNTVSEDRGEVRRPRARGKGK
jgi:arylsulfatase A-like enzyme